MVLLPPAPVWLRLLSPVSWGLSRMWQDTKQHPSLCSPDATSIHYDNQRFFRDRQVSFWELPLTRPNCGWGNEAHRGGYYTFESIDSILYQCSQPEGRDPFVGGISHMLHIRYLCSGS